MKCLIFLAALLGVSCAGVVKRQAQNPGVWSALDQLRGKARLGVDDIRALLENAKPGQDYPNLAEIPAGNFDCASQKPGFYADVDTKCQVIRRCDVNGNQSAYLCPNMTIFNQITLVCHWFYDVDCSKAKDFYDYSNSRLYQGHDVRLLDDENDYKIAEAVGAVSPNQAPTPAKASAGKKKGGKAKAKEAAPAAEKPKEATPAAEKPKEEAPAADKPKEAAPVAAAPAEGAAASGEASA